MATDAETMLRIRHLRRALGICTECDDEAAISSIRCIRHLQMGNQNGREHYQRTKSAIYDKYGNVCACCGESNKAFLSIDHVDGGGNKHRQQFRGHYMKAILADTDTSKYRLLCFNCNCVRGFRGHCPHEDEYVSVLA